jgi:hypothetical protein
VALGAGVAERLVDLGAVDLLESTGVNAETQRGSPA